MKNFYSSKDTTDGGKREYTEKRYIHTYIRLTDRKKSKDLNRDFTKEYI